MVLPYASIIISLHFQLCPSVTLRRTTSHPTDWNLRLLRPSLYPLLPPHPNTHKKTTFTPRVWAPLIIRRKHRPFFSFCLVTSLQYHTHFSPLTSHLVSHYKQALCQCGYYRLVSSARLPQAPWVFSFTQLGAEAAGEEEASPILCPRTAANAAYFLFSSVRTVYMQTPEGKKKNGLRVRVLTLRMETAESFANSPPPCWHQDSAYQRRSMTCPLGYAASAKATTLQMCTRCLT